VSREWPPWFQPWQDWIVAAVSVLLVQAFVPNGPYRVTRHPIYTGILGMLLGSAPIVGFGGAVVGTQPPSVTIQDRKRPQLGLG